MEIQLFILKSRHVALVTNTHSHTHKYVHKRKIHPSDWLLLTSLLSSSSSYSFLPDFFRSYSCLDFASMCVRVCCVCSSYSYSIHQYSACIRRFDSGKRFHSDVYDEHRVCVSTAHGTVYGSSIASE